MKCGFVALIGRTNVGKSTLMNHILGQKISITSRKPQTTRHRILGIKTTEDGQIIFMDTPGMHAHKQKTLNRYLHKTTRASLSDVDVIVWLIDGFAWHEYDGLILNKLKQVGLPVILAVNKIDRVKDKTAVLGFFSQAQTQFTFSTLLPISALKNINLDKLEHCILDLLPEQALIYPKEQITDRSTRFLIAEIVREKLTRLLGDELPFAINVEIKQIEEEKHITKIYALIWVERDTQKNIVIGKQGNILKKVGSQARIDIERLIMCKVYLQLWVKVKKNWSTNERILQNLSFTSAE